MVDEKLIINTTVAGNNIASGSKGKEVIRTAELAVEKELLNLKNKVAEQGKNESFLEFEKTNKVLKENYKNMNLKLSDIEIVKGKSIKNDLLFFEAIGDIVGNATLPFYGAWTKNRREKVLEMFIEYYQEQFNQLTTSFANDQANIFKEVESILKEKNNKIAEMVKGIEQLKEQYEAEKEIRSKKTEKEKQEAAIIKREKGEIQNALLSAEKAEIEVLRAERNQLRTTTEEQEAFLSRLFKEYENLELRRKLTVKELELMFSKLKIERIEAEQLRSDKIALSTDNTILNERVKNLTNGEKQAKKEIQELTSEKVTLEAKVTDLEADKKEVEKQLNQAIQKSRITAVGNIAQGAIEWLPIPEKWQGGLKTSIQAVSMWVLFKDLPNWTYEGFIVITGIGLWYALLHFLRKINRVIFGKKEKRQISNLEHALTNIFEKGAMGKKSEPEQKELNQPVAISKEPVKQEEILTQIPSEKTDPNITEKEEKEKPVQNSKKGKKAKKRKSKKKVKGDSS